MMKSSTTSYLLSDRNMAKTYIHRQSWTIPGMLLNDNTITARTKGLYAFIQSRPDGWDFSAEKIAEKMKDGRDSIRAWLRELESAWYLIRKRYQTDKWFFDIEYHLYESPTELAEEKPKTDYPSSDKPTSEKPSIINNTTVSTIINHSIINDTEKQKESEKPKPKNRAEEIESFFTLATTDPKSALISIWVSDPVFLEKILGDFDAFVEHWIEPTIKGDKVRWQKEPTFEPRLRFKKWIRNKIAWSKETKTQSRTSEVFTTTI